MNILISAGHSTVPPRDPGAVGNGLSVMPLVHMQGSVFGVSHYFQIVGAVIRFVLIFVVNHFVRAKRTTNHLFSHDNVLKHVSITGSRVFGHPNADVSLLHKATSVFPSVPFTPKTELAVTLVRTESFPFFRFLKSVSALRTGRRDGYNFTSEVAVSVAELLPAISRTEDRRTSKAGNILEHTHRVIVTGTRAVFVRLRCVFWAIENRFALLASIGMRLDWHTSILPRKTVKMGII